MARTGEPDDGGRLLREAVALAAETDDLNLHGDSLMALAGVLRSQGREGDARPAVAEAIDLYGRKGNVVSVRRASAFRESDVGR